MLFAFAQDESEGAMMGFSDYKGTRQIIEQIRFGYAFNKSVSITHDKSSSTGADNITLGDGVMYEKLLIGFHKALPITLNPRSCELPEDFAVLGNTDALRTGFCHTKQTNSRAFYAVEFESKTANSEFTNLKKYLLCENKEKWSSHIDGLISSGGYSLANLSALSGEALKELSNKQRINLLDKIAKVNMKDYDPLAARVMANVPSESITDLFEKLKQTTLFYTYKEQMNHDNYTEFIKSATLLYYQQDMLKEKLKNLTPDKMFAHQYREGSIGASITNEFSATTTDFTITGTVVVVSRSAGSESAFDAYNQQPNQTKSFQAYSNPVNYFDLIGVEMYSDLGNIQGNGKVIPMPAFYFDWLYTNQNRENTIKAIDASVTILSLAVGIGELRMVAAAGRGIFITKTSLGILKSAVNLSLLNDKIYSSFENQTWGDEFFIGWKTFCWVYDIATFDLKNVNKNRDFFNDFVMAWSVSKEVIQQNVEFELYEEINTLMSEIEENK